MKNIEELFVIHRARSGLFSEYELGTVAYVGNGLADNSIVGYVKPLATDKVFEFRAIVLSAFCEASVQLPPFIACGRAGNGLVVLEPRDPMNLRHLAVVAAYINQAVRWRFNWYRQITADRVRRLVIPNDLPMDITFDVKAEMPKGINQLPLTEPKLTFHPFRLDELFDLIPGNYHNLGALSHGTTPVVSCGTCNNGVVGHFEVSEHIHKGRLTIALNGSPLTTRYHPYQFAAKDDVAICLPKLPLRLTSLLFVELALNQERWRYSYYRKCYIEKLRRFQVMLPATKSNEIDEEAIEQTIHAAPYWCFLDERLGSTAVVR